ncbi:MAG: hypothetical protein AAFZ07_07710 [Actinomycetota bacterium]
MPKAQVQGRFTTIGDVPAYRIDGVERMEPFLTTVVSDSDLWMFLSSTGALTAGRVDADHALFPYLTDDRIHRAAGTVGPVSVVARTVGGRRELWRPFAPECPTDCSRAITKSTIGDLVELEERQHRWGLTWRATWVPSGAYGWVRRVELVDDGAEERDLEVLDGLLDVQPDGLDRLTEQSRSNLADAYKRSEAGRWGTAAIYTLESLVTDRAEPGESLSAAVVWSVGFPTSGPSLDERAVADMVAGRPSTDVARLTGRQGAYLLRGAVTVPAGGRADWRIVADTRLDQATVADRVAEVAGPGIVDRLDADVAAGRRRLHVLLAGADGFQTSADAVADAHHLSNVLFNSMRGGVFPYGYAVHADDLAEFLRVRNRPCADRHADLLDAVADGVRLADLHRLVDERDDPDLVRLVLEYLPLTFSRRHGDPSRPWNSFAIQVTDETGAEVLAYEGNWRDIFQNWEALLCSYPAYFPHVVTAFLDASTLDGHNPYRISRDGIDWEVPDPDDPWSNIGYWGDHQIVYLLRLLEGWERFAPGELERWAERAVFTYADVPYLLAEHDEMVRDPHDTVTFDVERAERIAAREAAIGTDGRLAVTTSGELVRAGLVEKLLVPALAKLSAFVPGGGIWMNTQRPEWNDANNALAGNGLSVVTLAHLVRYLRHLRDLVARLGTDAVPVSPHVGRWMAEVAEVLAAHEPVGRDDDRTRRQVLDALGAIGAAHRRRVIEGISGQLTPLPATEIERCCDRALLHLEDTLRAARRDDGLYDSYNLLSFPSDEEAAVAHLGPMLEGQVAVLASGMLDARACLAVVDALAGSDLYRADQDSYLLYPATVRPSFLDRNTLTDAQVARAPFLADRGDARWRAIVVPDRAGRLHFAAGLAHAGPLRAALDQIGATAEEAEVVEAIYEEQFDHAAFTGRSGAMYGYEGIGSIYWHMVAKLLLVVQERQIEARLAGEAEEVVQGLASAYRRIRDGLGFRKGPDVFGAFPVDCYSHTPAGAGAKQPGMTGQVKEEVLARSGELGLRVVDGTLELGPPLIDPTELFGADLSGAVALTVCSVPVTISIGASSGTRVTWFDGRVEASDGSVLDRAAAAAVFGRDGSIERLDLTLDRGELATGG